MGLKITFSDKGVSYVDSYHRASFKVRDKKLNQLSIVVKVYANKAFADQNPNKNFKENILNVDPSDFQSYFNTSSYVEGALYPEKVAYDFLKTIDPDEENSKYPDWPYDYKNDSIDQ